MLARMCMAQLCPCTPRAVLKSILPCWQGHCDAFCGALQDFVSAVMDVDYAPTGREFVAGGYDRSVRIFAHNGGHSREVGVPPPRAAKGYANAQGQNGALTANLTT